VLVADLDQKGAERRPGSIARAEAMRTPPRATCRSIAQVERLAALADEHLRLL